jgi:signal transduction histidine kinase
VAWQLPYERAALAAAIVCAAALLAAAAVGTRRRLVRADRIRSLLSLGAPLAGDALRDALRALTADPSLEIYYRVQGRAEYVTSSGELVAPAFPAGTRPARTIIGAGTADEHGFAVLVDTVERGARAARRLRRALVDAAAPALENAWLQATLRRQVADLARARSQTVRAFLAERRRLEGHLHDGTQAALHEARYQVRQARLHVAGSSAATCIDAAVATLNEAIAELRSLARGIYPAGLRESGLGAALFAATSSFPLAVDITGDADDRIDEETATAGFFTTMDVLYIAARSRARTAKVRISAAEGRARIQIAYRPGAGMPPAAPGPDETGAWLAAEDRVRALDGTMQITQAEATVLVEADLPCAS